MSLYLILGLIVLAFWLVESIVFLAGYKHSSSS
jgi:flagellar biogenesis protein FliO